MAEALVVDASVAVKWHLPDEDDLAAASRLLVAFGAGEIGLVEPDVIHLEVASAITSATLGRRPRITIVEGEAAIAAFIRTAIETRPGTDLVAAAFGLVHLHGCAFSDAVYLALAQRLHLPFITADRRFYQRTGHLPEVVLLADYPLPSTP